ncbi:MAG: methyltransferase domain-containing protein [Ilumatobacter sp.]|nr:methyltransferase domain-containing protein [Ilumatobacter sp.]
MTVISNITEIDEERLERFAGRFFEAVLGAQEVQAAYFGEHLGWYAALGEHGPLTAPELATATGTHQRYVQEWLEHQAVAGWIEVDDVTAAPLARRYHLPAEHAAVLTDPDALTHLAPLARFTVGIGRHVDELARVYRDGGGVSWDDMGDDLRLAQAALNRPMFLELFAREFVASIPEVDARLRAGGRVADVGCGFGWSSIAIAEQYPAAVVDGFDPDAPSVVSAALAAAERGLDGRVRFHAVDAATAASDDSYDLVMALECIHDLGDPVGVLSTMRELAGTDGFVLVMDERVGDDFAAPGEEFERLLYGFSLTSCLPDCMSHEHSAETGTVMRRATLERYARGAGFESVEVLPIEHDSFRFYRLVTA